MDALALNDMQLALQAFGFTGSPEQLRELLLKAERETRKRLLLMRWDAMAQQTQHEALVRAYAHADKHGMDVTVHEGSLGTTLVFSRERGYKGVLLGALDVSEAEVRWRFYQDGEYVGDRTTLGSASRTRATPRKRSSSAML